MCALGSGWSCSPTTDRAPARQAIADLKLDERTATGEGIISSLQAIQTFQKTISGADGPAPARIVLMTDGKRTVGRDETDAAKQAADAKVPISVIAFGTTHGSINLDGSEIPVPLDTEAMQQIAKISGGDFHTAATHAKNSSPCTPSSASRSVTSSRTRTSPNPG